MPRVTMRSIISTSMQRIAMIKGHSMKSNARQIQQELNLAHCNIESGMYDRKRSVPERFVGRLHLRACQPCSRQTSSMHWSGGLDSKRRAQQAR